MKVYQVEIKLTKDMLCNNGNQVGIKKPTASKKAQDEETTYGTPEQQAARTMYYLNGVDGELCFPSTNIHSAMKEVAAAYKSGKKSIKEFVAGSVTLEPDLIPLGTKTYKIDSRRVVIMKKAILRCRGKIAAGTKLGFNLLVEDDFPDREPGGVLKQVLEEGLRRKGIGDFRPGKGGPFGKAIVTEFREIKGR